MSKQIKVSFNIKLDDLKVRDFKAPLHMPFGKDKVNSSAELEFQSWRARNSSRGATLDTSLGNWAPLDVEIGCGVGWHPISYAQHNPQRHLIAIEHTREKFDRFKTRLKTNAFLPNLFPVHADATLWLDRNLEANSIDRVFILYPNPEPKAPNKRWLRSPFMHRILELLRPEGELQLATNECDYFSEALTYAKGYWNLELVEMRELKKSDDLRARTHFERKYLARGETCFDVVWRKVRR